MCKSVKMNVCGVILFVLCVSSISAYRMRIKRQAKPVFVQPGASPPLSVNDEVELANVEPNINIRRGHKSKIPRSYEVKVLNMDNLKSLELDESLDDLLDLDTQDKKKENVGFKVVNLKDFDHDRKVSKKSKSKKVKLVQSMQPPNKFFEKFNAKNVEKKGAVNNLDLQSFLDNMNTKNLQDQKKFSNMYGSGSLKSKSKFNKDGMMFLTKPKNSEGRNLNSLIDKVLNYRAIQTDKRNNLRQPTEAFTFDEMNQIQKIARAIEEEDDREDNQPDELEKLLEQELQPQEEDTVRSQEREQNLAKLQALENLVKDAGPINIIVDEVPTTSKRIQQQIAQTLRMIEQAGNQKDQASQLNAQNKLALAQILADNDIQSRINHPKPKDEDEYSDSDTINSIHIVKLGPPKRKLPVNKGKREEKEIKKQTARNSYKQSGRQLADEKEDDVKTEFDFQELVA